MSEGASAGWPLNGLARDWASTPPGGLEVALAEARRLRPEGAGPVLDLVTANPHDHGLVFPAEQLEAIAVEALRGSPTVSRYAPESLGQWPAREAVAGFYRRRGCAAEAQAVALTPGTSIGYAWALQLLTRPGDDVLAPRPGYPLFDNLCALGGLRLRHYHLGPEKGGWRLDFDELEFQCTPRTRVLMLVSPHNPTGMVLSAGDLARLGDFCRRRRIVAILDEVFSEFLAAPLTTLPRPAAGDFPLILTLNGFSKMFSLPGWKLAWIKVDGDAALRDPFLRALDHLADTFLPVNELVQAMVPGILAAGDPAVSGALSRTLEERRRLALELMPWPVRAPEAGVYLCPSLPEGTDEQGEALRLLREHGLFVHPGYYYGLTGHLVLTAVARPEELREGLGRVRGG